MHVTTPEVMWPGGVSAAWSEQKSEQKTGPNPNRIVVQVQLRCERDVSASERDVSAT